MGNYPELEAHLCADLNIYRYDQFGIVSDDTLEKVYGRSLAASFYKKLCPNGDTKLADAKALEKFLAINSALHGYPFDFLQTDEQESIFWDYLKNNLNGALYSEVVIDSDSETDDIYDLNFIREHMLPGPGSAQKADSRTFAHKLFTGEMSYTNDYLIPYYRAALAETGLWADAEMHRFEQFGFTKVRGSSIFFAKKNAEISRTCCTEANLNMLVQKSVGDFIEKRLESRFNINLSNQPDRNKNLARLGSIDGSFGTIDLTSASDSIASSLVYALLEPSLLKTMIFASRSEFAVTPDGNEVKMNMISTMGNGFTFPLQTIIFASAVRSVYQMMGYPCTDSKKHFGVFGDDIVVRRETYVFLCRMLNKLGFSVNEGKSFNTGPFRESCGGDYYLGHNVRGVYIRSLETSQLVASAINRLNRWSAASGIPLTQTMKHLNGLARSLRIPRVPPSESDDAGIKVPFRLTQPRVDNSYWFRYRYLAVRTKKLLLAEPDDTPNPCGFGVAFLGGYVRRSDCEIGSGSFATNPIRVPLRDPPNAVKRHKIRFASIPFWDWPGLGEGGDPFSHTRWETHMMATYSIE